MRNHDNEKFNLNFHTNAFYIFDVDAKFYTRNVCMQIYHTKANKLHSQKENYRG